MGVVRREGNWRLHKRDDGVYEITKSEQVEMKIITSEYTADRFTDERMDFTVAVREVDSFSEAEELFQELAQNGTSLGSQTISAPQGVGEIGTAIPESNTDTGLEDLPPVGVLLIGFIGGGYAISQSGFAISSPVFLLGTGLVVIGLAVAGLAYERYLSDGMDAAIGFLLSSGDNMNENTTENSDKVQTEKTPPAPEGLKNELYFDRADRQCEWCDKEIDSPDVHHIEPRSEGGSNESDNLIVLCPNCHRKADRGAISRSKLRYAASE